MTQWYSKELGDGIDALTPSNKIQEAFIPLFASAGQPLDMAVFSRYDHERNMVTVYFAPGASALAAMFGATPCEKPRKEGRLSLLVGNYGCVDLLFPRGQ